MYCCKLTQWILLHRPSVYHVYHIIVSDIAAKTRCFGLHFCRRQFRFVFNHFYAVRPEATEFSEIRQNNGHYAVQGHSRSPILVPVESSYDFLLVVNTNLPSILFRLRDIAFDRSKIAILVTLLRLNPPAAWFPWDDLRKFFRGCQRMASVRQMP